MNNPKVGDPSVADPVTPREGVREDESFLAEAGIVTTPNESKMDEVTLLVWWLEEAKDEVEMIEAVTGVFSEEVTVREGWMVEVSETDSIFIVPTAIISLMAAVISIGKGVPVSSLENPELPMTLIACIL